MSEVTISIKQSLLIDVLNGLERIISSKTEYKKDQLKMANNVIEEIQKEAFNIKQLLVNEVGEKIK